MKRRIFAFLALFLCCPLAVYADQAVLPEGNFEKIKAIMGYLGMPPKNIWIYLAVLVVLITVMFIDLKHHEVREVVFAKETVEPPKKNKKKNR